MRLFRRKPYLHSEYLKKKLKIQIADPRCDHEFRGPGVIIGGLCVKQLGHIDRPHMTDYGACWSYDDEVGHCAHSADYAEQIDRTMRTTRSDPSTDTNWFNRYVR